MDILENTECSIFWNFDFEGKKPDFNSGEFSSLASHDYMYSNQPKSRYKIFSISHQRKCSRLVTEVLISCFALKWQGETD